MEAEMIYRIKNDYVINGDQVLVKKGSLLIESHDEPELDEMDHPIRSYIPETDLALALCDKNGTILDDQRFFIDKSNLEPFEEFGDLPGSVFKGEIGTTEADPVIDLSKVPVWTEAPKRALVMDPVKPEEKYIPGFCRFCGLKISLTDEFCCEDHKEKFFFSDHPELISVYRSAKERKQNIINSRKAGGKK